jgi:hypothetical protein
MGYNLNMKPVLFLVVLAFGIIAAGCFSEPANGQKSAPAVQNTLPQERRPVLVELFTSEGCSSCPPADRALKFLAEQQPVNNAQIIPLAFHVDYWDHLGWKDRFSSHEYTRRQESYVERFGLESSYTPEMVVDGEAEFIGSDTGRAAKVITDAAAKQKGSVLAELTGDLINVSISALPDHHPATVFLAVTEGGLTSDVKAGENAGQTLNQASVVRSLTPLGLVDKAENSAKINGNLPAITDLKRENSQFVVFVQDNVNRQIIAAGIAQNGKQTN